MSHSLIKACYFLEGDGPLALECYEAMEKVSASLRVGNTPNVDAIAQRLREVLPIHVHRPSI